MRIAFKSLADLFLFIHKITIESVLDVWRYWHYDYGAVYVVPQIGITILLCVAVLATDALIFFGIYMLLQRLVITILTKEIKRTPVTGKVTGKEHIKARKKYMYNGKVWYPIRYPSRHYIYVKYGEIEKEFDSKKLYKKYKKHDPISLILVERIGIKGRIIETKLELPE